MSDQFGFFNHLYHHERVSRITATAVNQSMTRNKKFAQITKLSVMSDYMVTPYHSGIYPVNDNLWDTWVNEQGIKYCSTPMYTKSSQWYDRRGFIYRGIKVLPRMTSGLKASTQSFSEMGYSSDTKVQLFFNVLLHIPVFAFSTHILNFLSERPAAFILESGFKLLKEYTNIKLHSPPPKELAERYFNMFPEDAIPLWKNPCTTILEKWIMDEEIKCSNFPKFLVVGPEKDGTKALQTYLKSHPKTSSYKKDGPGQADGLQFFNKEYLRGSKWYQDNFVEPEDPTTLLFDSCAAYFENKDTPKRVKELLPFAKIIIVLPEQAETIWDLHEMETSRGIALNHKLLNIKPHPDPTADQLTIDESKMAELELFLERLEVWLHYFSKEQVLIVDSRQLKKNSTTELNQIQNFLGIN